DLRVNHHLHLRTYKSINGESLQVPSVRRIDLATVSGRSYAVGTQTTAHLNGGGGEAPGIWVARISGPAT
ncbi:MAG TPA: hypothetical protein VEA19_02155, partial [Actinomycetota bacterium]|nr:hypothetical protein [Actinomycetota bacterium]